MFWSKSLSYLQTTLTFSKNSLTFYQMQFKSKPKCVENWGDI